MYNGRCYTHIYTIIIYVYNPTIWSYASMFAAVSDPLNKKN